MSTLQYPKFKAFSTAGLPLVGGKLYTLKAGTTWPTGAKLTYTDVDLTTQATNPVVLDAAGEAMIYTNGLYKLILTDAADQAMWTLDNIRGIGFGSLKLLSDYGGDLEAAIADINTDPVMLVIDCAADALTTALTIPSTVGLWITPAGSIAAGAYNVAVNGPVIAGKHHWIIQTGVGVVSFAAGTYDWAYPEWWGAVGDSGTTNDTPYWYDMIQSINASGWGKIRLTGDYSLLWDYATYANTYAFSSVTGLVILGEKGASVTIRNGAKSGTFVLGGTTYDEGTVIAISSCTDVEVGGFEVDGNCANVSYGGSTPVGSNCHGVDVNGCTRVYLHDLYVHHCGMDGINPNGASSYVTIERVKSHYNARQGISLGSVTNLTVRCSEFAYTGKTVIMLPGAGLDIEPNSTTSIIVKDILFEDCKFYGNSAGELRAAGNQEGAEGIVFVRCRFEALEESGVYGSAYVGDFASMSFYSCYFAGEFAVIMVTDPARHMLWEDCDFVQSDDYEAGSTSSCLNCADALLQLRLRNCRFTVSGSRRFVYATSGTNKNERVFDGCTFTYDGATLADMDTLGNFRKGCTLNDCKFEHTGTDPATGYYVRIDNDATNVLHNTESISAELLLGETYATGEQKPHADLEVVSIPDEGTGAAAAYTLDTSASSVQITCLDANNANITMGETKCYNGQVMRITNMGAPTLAFARDTNVLYLSAATITLGQYDTLTLQYAVNRWVEVAHSDNS